MACTYYKTQWLTLWHVCITRHSGFYYGPSQDSGLHYGLSQDNGLHYGPSQDSGLHYGPSQDTVAYIMACTYSGMDPQTKPWVSHCACLAIHISNEANQKA